MNALAYGSILVVTAMALASLRAPACAQTTPPKDLSGYLTDITAGTVSAGNIVGLSESAVTPVQTSQDLVVALKPFSSGGSKTGFGLAVTPARTTITPMSGQTYLHSAPMRVIGATTLSYAENTADVSGSSYRKSGFSIDTSYYLNPNDDPVLAANNAFVNCPPKTQALRRANDAALKGDRDALKEAQHDAEGAVKRCVDDALASSWNKTRLSLSLGAGWIKPDTGPGTKESLGRSATLAGVVQATQYGAIYMSLRRTVHEVDIATLKTAPEFKDSSLAAARFTYGSMENKPDLKMLAEISNAKSSQVTASNSAFKYAVGVDKLIGKGAWLEFRLGRKRTFDGTNTETASLMTFNWTPTSGLFSK